MEAHVHLTGNVGGDVEYRKNTVAVATFRLACTPRVRKAGEWTDGATTWLTVTCFRGLADNVASSLGRGDPVLVSGRLRTNVWSKDGVNYERLVLEATSVGHDLTWGTSAFVRTPRTSEPSDRQEDVGELITSVESQEPDADGRELEAAVDGRAALAPV
jgi:single-strand DNA-binding protein